MYEFLHFGIHENAFTTTQNALIPQHLGALPPGPLAGALPPAPPWGTAPRPASPPARFSGSATGAQASLH